MNASLKTKRSPYDTPPWRRSHKATSPNGALTAEIAEAREHSMSNPTVGTLRMSDGFELQKCNPAFTWSNDSRYLAVPQWIRRFGLFLRQRLVIVDVNSEVVFASRFTYWLLQPRKFVDGRLEVAISSSIGITWEREQPLVLDVPKVLKDFVRLSTSHRKSPTNKPMHGSGEVGRTSNG